MPEKAKEDQRPHTQKNTRKSILLRLDPFVHDALAKWASDELRSVNAQIEIILRRALTQAGREYTAAPLRSRGRPSKQNDISE
ncbi:hypothetical protein [Schaalia sp. lx-260]|uniref:hypothetical protein n=1 Tax=Schaalia sp. lx-260 TaxID=2899082 RepID=UPI001E52501D|nr:hypothetical protein [Schaalia sp. lx-260]MCD4549953.1 hypothetical protein [Schaalia sp. lx-260]